MVKESYNDNIGGKAVSLGTKFKGKIYKPIKCEKIKSNLIFKNHIILRKDDKINKKKEVFIIEESNTIKDVVNKDSSNNNSLNNKNKVYTNQDVIVEELKKLKIQKEEEMINFLNDDSHGAFFSISMSIQQNSVFSNPLLDNKPNNNTNNINNDKIFTNEIEEIIDDNSSLHNEVKDKKIILKPENQVNIIA